MTTIILNKIYGNGNYKSAHNRVDALERSFNCRSCRASTLRDVRDTRESRRGPAVRMADSNHAKHCSPTPATARRNYRQAFFPARRRNTGRRNFFSYSSPPNEKMRFIHKPQTDMAVRIRLNLPMWQLNQILANLAV